MLACKRCHMHQVAHLIHNCNVDVNAHELEWPFNTALHYAYKFQYPELIEYLVQQGADTSIMNVCVNVCFDHYHLGHSCSD
jgi:hypothetical protein